MPIVAFEGRGMDVTALKLTTDDVAEFIQHATEANIPFDFVSTHMYPTDPQCPGGRGQGANWGPDCFSDGVKELRASVLARATLVLP